MNLATKIVITLSSWIVFSMLAVVVSSNNARPQQFSGNEFVITVGSNETLRLDNQADYKAESNEYFSLDNRVDMPIRGAAQNLKPVTINWNQYWLSEGSITAGDWNMSEGWTRIYLKGKDVKAFLLKEKGGVISFNLFAALVDLALCALTTYLVWTTKL